MPLLLLATGLGLVATPKLSLPPGRPEQAELLAIATHDRQEMAGWLRGTEACAAGRVSRHVAQMLRDRGIEAEFHPAGKTGGYTVASVGPADDAPVAIIVAEVVSCPAPPVDEELAFGADAVGLWRAAAIAASLTSLARSEPTRRVQALFLGGDGAKSCGRTFAFDTLPTLEISAPVLDVGGSWKSQATPPRLTVVTARDGEQILSLHAHGEPSTAKNRLSTLRAKVLEPAIIGSIAAKTFGDTLALRCRATALDLATTLELACLAPEGYTTRDVAFALHELLPAEEISMSYANTAFAAAPVIEPDLQTALFQALHATGPVATVVAEQGAADTCGVDGPAQYGLGLPLVPDASDHPGPGDPKRFTRGVVWTRALLEALSGVRVAKPAAAGTINKESPQRR